MNTPFLAGAATRDLSPQKPMALHGYPHVPRVSTGIHDPILATALWLEQGHDKVLLVSLDLLFMDPPTARELRRRLAEETGAGQERIMVNCTHTHSAPIMAPIIAWREDPSIPPPDPEYRERVLRETVAAAKAAVAAAVPAELAWTTADATGVGGNRLADGGITDPEVGILAVRRQSKGEWIAFSLTYGMHPTVLHEDSKLVSADFPHYARLVLQEQFAPNAPVLYQTGPSGNQSPRHFVKEQTFAEAERLGRKLGNAAAAAITDLDDQAFGEAKLGGALAQVPLTPRDLPSLAEAEAQLKQYQAEYKRLQQENAPHPQVRTAECALFGAEGAVTLARAAAAGDIAAIVKNYQPIEVQAIRIGNALLAGLPGEWFTEYALEIKQAAAMKCFVVSLVNGELQGYVVTPEAQAAGGYEANNTLFPPEEGQKMIQALLQLIQDLA